MVTCVNQHSMAKPMKERKAYQKNKKADNRLSDQYCGKY